MPTAELFNKEISTPSIQAYVRRAKLKKEVVELLVDHVFVVPFVGHVSFGLRGALIVYVGFGICFKDAIIGW